MDARVIVITGASSGIGAAVAEHVSRDGARVVLVARRTDALADVAARCHGRGHPIVADVTNRDDLLRVADEAIARFGHIDVWINNAGRGITRQPTELTGDDIDDMVEVNVKSVLFGMQAVLPHFKARGTGQIINVSSMLGRIPFAVHRSAYSAAKHFVNALTQMFRDDVQKTHPGIQVTLVSPGVVRTDFGLNAKHGGEDSRAISYSQSAEEVAAVIAGVIESRKPDVYTREGSRERVASYYATLGEDAG